MSLTELFLLHFQVENSTVEVIMLSAHTQESYYSQKKPWEVSDSVILALRMEIWR